MKHFKKLTYIFSLLIISKFCIAQKVINFPQGNSVFIPCDSVCVKLYAQHPKPLSSTVYTVTSIPFQPLQNFNGASLQLSDDSVSGPINIGFTFCFFGANYNNIFIGANGFATFNPNFASINSNTNMQNALPFSSGTFPGNAIFFPHMDVDPSQGGQIKYATTGTAPYRKFIVSFTNMPLFGTTLCSTNNNYYLELQETSNIIEVHIANKGVCNATFPTNIDYGTIGIQDAGTFLVAPNRNAAVFTATQESWAFRPFGVKNYSVNWLTLINNSLKNLTTGQDTIITCLPDDTVRYIANFVGQCPNLVGSDTLLVYRYRPIIAPIPNYTVNCAYNKQSVLVSASSIYNPIKYKLDGLPFTANPQFNNLDTGVHSILIKDSLGCLQSTSFLISATSKLKLQLDSSKDADCNAVNGEAYLSSIKGVLPYKYSWTNGLTTSFATNLAPTTNYTVYVKDSLNCIDSLFIIVQEIKPSGITDSLIKPTCPDSNGAIYISVIFGTPPYTFLWNTGATTSFIKNLVGDSVYTCKITDSLGCIGNFSQYLFEDNLPTVDLVGILPTCKKSNGSITATVGNALLPISILWSNGQTNATASNLDSNFYYVTIKDAKGCDTVKGLSLKDTLDMKLLFTKTSTTCGLSNGSISFTPSVGLAPYTYAWLPTGTGSAPTNLAAGTYTCTVTDAIQCIKSSTVLIGASSPILMQANKINPFCDSANGKIIIGAINATAPVYSINGTVTGDTVKNIAAGVYVISVTDNKGCTASTIVTLIDEGSPSQEVIKYVPPICNGDSSGVLELSGTGGVPPYKYSVDGNNFQPNAIIENVFAGTYKIYLKDANACTIDTLITFTEPSKIIITVAKLDTLICYNDRLASLNFSVIGGVPNYKSSLDGGSFSSTLAYQYLQNKPHLLAIADAVGCIISIPISIPSPDTVLYLKCVNDSIPCFEDSTGTINCTLKGGWPPYTYNWDIYPNDSLKINKVDGGFYKLNVQDAKGCKAILQTEIFEQDCCTAHVPNAFTPNGDDINDILLPILQSTVEAFEFKIYNRWGNVLFTSKSPKIGWGGKFNNIDLPSDTYFYSLQIVCPKDNERYLIKGATTLIR